MNLRGRAARGAAITGLSQGVRLLVQIGSVIVLSRLLEPADFGLMAMAAPVFGFVMMFQDLGLTQATIQKNDITQAQVSALFWVNLAASFVLAVAMVAAAPLVAMFYGDPRVENLVVAFGMLVLVAGLGSQHMALLNRKMRFGALAAIDASAVVCGFLAGVLFAQVNPSYWALYVASLVTIAIPAVAAWICTGWLPGAPRRAAEVRELLNFGAGITGFNFINFFARNADNIMIGRVWGEHSLGVYDRAYKLLLLPLQQVSSPLGRVTQPILSQLLDEPERYRRAYVKTLHQMLLIVLPGVAFMIGTSDILVPTLLGQKWVEAAAIFSALGFAAILQPVNNTTGWLFISQARGKDYFQGGLFGTCMAVLGMLAGLPWGAFGVAVGYAVSEYLKTPVIWWWATRKGPVALRDLAGASFVHLAGVAVSLAAIMVLRRAFEGGPFETMLLCLVAAYAVAFGTVFSFASGRAAIGESMALLQSGLGVVAKRRPH
ncbi:lipopolysaccharide biosynthesis protein [Aureimonas populi]|uniref:Lipopolysaccharide biosynthesis protein n=1 Tax=Aureimonas populi TaxID=1701758 RepID=A0ABW5CLG4_9HYPH|nr:lipopolysaccharide biosynthesis protein [Aureimonas populi]